MKLNRNTKLIADTNAEKINLMYFDKKIHVPYQQILFVTPTYDRRAHELCTLIARFKNTSCVRSFYTTPNSGFSGYVAFDKISSKEKERVKELFWLPETRPYIPNKEYIENTQVNPQKFIDFFQLDGIYESIYK